MLPGSDLSSAIFFCWQHTTVVMLLMPYVLAHYPADMQYVNLKLSLPGMQLVRNMHLSTSILFLYT